jgi:hypothetical protein
VTPLFGTAIFGASFTLRVIAQLVVTAGALLRKSDGDLTRGALHFCGTEALARDWLLKRRQIIAQAKRAP